MEIKLEGTITIEISEQEKKEIKKILDLIFPKK